MVKIVVPQRIEPVPAALRRAHQSGVLRLVFADDDRVPAASSPADLAGYRRQDVHVGGVEHLLGRVEAQPVEVVFLGPIAGIGEHEFANRPAVGPVKIDRLAPLVLVPVGEIAFGKAFQVIAVRAEMVVDDVEDDRHAERVGPIDEGAEIVGPEPVAHAGPRLAHRAGKIAIRLGGEPHRRQPLDLDGDLAAARRPQPEKHAPFGPRFGADRQTPPRRGSRRREWG